MHPPLSPFPFPSHLPLLHLQLVLDFSNFQLKDCRPLPSLQSSTDSLSFYPYCLVALRAKAVTQRTLDTLKGNLKFARKE